MPNPTKRDLALANQLDALQKRYERRYEKQIFTALKKQMQPYLDAIKQADGNINRFDLITPAPLADTLESLYVVAGTAYADSMYNAIQPPTKATKEALRAGWRDFMRSFAIKNLPQTLIKINETSQKIIRNIVTSGLNEGLGTVDVARNIQQSVNVIFKNRAKLIARTEMVIASNVAAMESSKTSDFMYEKKWIPATDTRTRPDHAEMRAKPWIPFDQNFIVGGNQMRQPGDGSQGAGADQICNCRCKVVFRIMRDADGLPMRKLGSQSGAYNLENPAVQFNQVNQPFNPIADNLEDAKEISKKIIDTNTVLKVGKTEFAKSVNLEDLNKWNNQLNQLTKDYNLSPHLNNKTELKLAYSSDMFNLGFVEADAFKIREINFGSRKIQNPTINRAWVENGKTKFANNVKTDLANNDLYVLTHEFAHVISMESSKQWAYKFPEIERFWSELSKIKSRYKKERNQLAIKGDVNGLNEIYLGDYAETNKNEFMAEAFTEYKLNSNPSKYALEVGQLIDKYFKK
jgi:hypothetical protein